MNNKNIGIILLLIAGGVLIGLLSRWDFNTWRIIDSVIVLATFFLGVVLIQKDGVKLKSVANLLKSKRFWLIFTIVIILGLIFFISLIAIDRVKKEEAKCKFNLTNIVENRYQEDKEAYSEKCATRVNSYIYNFGCDNGFRNYSARHMTYWEIDGLLKNYSKKDQYLKSVILKIYTNDDRKILLAENFLNANINLTPNQSYPFQVRTNINRDGEMGKYFEKDDKVVIDVYPYFWSCNY